MNALDRLAATIAARKGADPDSVMDREAAVRRPGELRRASSAKRRSRR